ncbi:MAG: 1-deoxy-D-xylulose-5-phosphate reductoisomerase [Oscillospiraceae bacterium]|nr:1-deoxy-D-xylulose-5-phosphate reductoisomerase [Oscillospiraceae bacterium]
MKISILGSTGSIGTQTLEIVRDHPDEFEVAAITGNKNTNLLEAQAREFRPSLVCVADEDCARELKLRLADTGIKVLGGKDSIIEAAAMPEAETVVVSVVGMAGIEPTIAAIKSRKRVALANKETLVAAGNIIKQCEAEYGKCIIPVDSEHSAIFQSMLGMSDKKEIKRILLTASGGEFFGKKREDLVNITPQQALHNPNWDMGAKVTIDSSTLVNKGLETIEAKWLFDIQVDDIKVLIHRQSVVHSAVEFTDNAVIAQLGAPDMRLPIQFALTYPNRLSIPGNELDLFKYGSLTFDEPDTETFYALELARQAGRCGGGEGSTLATVFNSADEAAVEMFMKGKLSYLGITDAIAEAMARHKSIVNPTLDDIYAADKEAREIVKSKF